jgi:VanZ family protein
MERMSGVFQRLRYWGPLVLWMGVIFWASADSGSGRRGARILGPLLRWWMPEASSQRMEEVIFLIRKAAHVSEYAVLAWLAWRVFLAVRRSTVAPQPLRAALLAWGLSVIYAVSDEWHQTFVPTRVGTPWDVLIDAAGAALGLALAGLWWRWQRWRRPL